MAKLLFLSRVALICNACFLISFLFHYLPYSIKELVPPTVVIMGYILSFILNALTSLSIAFLAIIGKPVFSLLPLWLLTTNFLFFVFQIVYLML